MGAQGRSPTIKPDSEYARTDLLKHVLTLATAVLGRLGKAFKWTEEANPYLGRTRETEKIVR